MARDYYDVLGVPRDASADEIQQAFRKLARKHHPDVNKDPQAEERFKEINEAYSVLSDPKTRQRYDRFGEDFRQIPEDYDERVAAGAGARGGPVRPAGRRRPGPLQHRRRRRGSTTRASTSRTCSAGCSGAVPAAEASGRSPGPTRRPRSSSASRRPTGAATAASPSPARTGSGPTTSTSRAEWSTGSASGWPGRAAGAAATDPRATCYLRVRIKPDPQFRLDGRDIHVALPVTPWEAALGATVPVPTPGGTAKVTVPAGSSSGRRLRLRGEGMPNPRGADGDLYAEIRIMVPPELDDAGARAVRGAGGRVHLRPEEARMSNDPRSAAAPGPGGASRTEAAPAQHLDVRVRSYAIVPVRRLSLDTVARRSGLHPDLVRRFVSLGLVDADRDARGRAAVRPDRSGDPGPHPAVAGRAPPQLRVHRPGARPARPHQPSWKPRCGAATPFEE